jgi:hypothetical protein
VCRFNVLSSANRTFSLLFVRGTTISWTEENASMGMVILLRQKPFDVKRKLLFRKGRQLRNSITVQYGELSRN